MGFIKKSRETNVYSIRQINQLIMGVITCDRTGCENIMADYHVHGIGDCCQECVDEFKETFYSGGDVRFSFERFMTSQKERLYSHQQQKVDEFFEPYKRNW